MSDNSGSRPIIEPLPAEAQAADTKKLSMKGLKLELDDLSEIIEDTVLNEMIRLVDAVNELKDAQNTLSSNQTILQEGMFVLSGDVMKANPPTPQLDWTPEAIKEPEPEPPQTRPIAGEETMGQKLETLPQLIQKPEPEPENLQFGRHQHSVFETIADSCIVMNDILLLCKAMKKVPELTDQTRMSLLDLAGRRAGIEITPGMQVRAGVKMIVA